MRNTSPLARAAQTARAAVKAPARAPARPAARVARAVFVTINGNPVAPVALSLADYATASHFALDIVAALAWAETGLVPTSLIEVGTVARGEYRGRFKAGRREIAFGFKGTALPVENATPAPAPALTSAETPAPAPKPVAKPVAKPVTPQVDALPGMSPLGLKVSDKLADGTPLADAAAVAKAAQMTFDLAPKALPAPAVAAAMKATAAEVREARTEARVHVTLQGCGTFAVVCTTADIASPVDFARNVIAPRVAQYHGWPRCGVDYASRTGTATFTGAVSCGPKRQVLDWVSVPTTAVLASPLLDRAGMGLGRGPAVSALDLGARMGLTPAGHHVAQAEAKAKAAGVRLARHDRAAAEALDAAAVRTAAGKAPVSAAPRMNAANAAIFERAAAGELPPAPDFTADTHTRYRPKLAELVALVTRGDVTALRAYPINPISTSPKALERYRNAAVIALEAQAAKRAGKPA